MQVHFLHIARELLLRLRSARSSIKVAVAWFTNEELFKQLCDKAANGVDVQLLIVNDFINNGPNRLDFQRLISLGGQLYFGDSDNLMHHKFCVIDGGMLVNGSYNWTYFAEFRNQENITVSTDPEAVQAFEQEFNRLTSSLTVVRDAQAVPPVDWKTVDPYFRSLIGDDLALKSFGYESRGDYARAVSIAKRAIEINPANNEYHKQLSSLELKQQASARSHFVPSATVIRSEKLASFNDALRQGVREYKRKQFLNAIDSFQRALTYNDDFAELHFWTGLCNWRLGQFEAVMKACDAAISTNPGYAVALNLRGIARSEKNNPHGAIADFSQAIACDAKLFKAFFNRGLVYKKLTRATEAAQDFNTCISLLNELILQDPADEEALSIRGDAYSLTNRESMARDDYKKAKTLFDSKQSYDKDLNNEDRFNSGLNH